ncbi:hypothetical protein RHGRI_027002 [Rhododendron griersonianum]|uniref:Uncharacterized protein n=1 Tax=Rhododendron griersonianum TaxID=479676 RepID=A0AAV6IUP0_9ERIC|nr:hypothetical protein RHGRI_027002 [Rhododendron griersonianum]
MAPRNILADLEKRKKQRHEEERAKAAAKSAHSAGGHLLDKETPRDTRAEKRQKTTEVGSVGETETAKGKGTVGSSPTWRPLFVTPEGRQITAKDSLAADPSIARVLFHGLALPKDVTLPESLKSAIDDHYFHAGRAMQSLMQAQLYIVDVDKRTKAQQLVAERYKKQLDNSELERGKMAEQVTNLNEMVKQLTGATEQPRSEGKKEMEKEMREEMEREREEKEGIRRRVLLGVFQIRR